MQPNISTAVSVAATLRADAPSRPARQLTPLAEAIIAACAEHMCAGNGGQPGAAETAKRSMLAQFADIGVSSEYVRLLAQVLA